MSTATGREHLRVPERHDFFVTLIAHEAVEAFPQAAPLGKWNEIMAGTRHCPNCRQGLLDRIEASGSYSELCIRCRGLWFEAGNLSEAIRQHDPDAKTPANRVADSATVRRGLSKDDCPNCETPLVVHDLSETNPTHVETCAECGGIWLPHGSLDRALAGHQLPGAQALVAGEAAWRHWFMQFLTGLPVEFNVAPRKRPSVTYGLIAANVLVYLFTTITFMTWQMNFDAFALDPNQMPGVNWFVGLLTSQFLHANLIHLAGNLYFLWILGDNVEDVLGGPAFLAFFLAAGIAGGVFYSVTSEPALPVIGASGAISGVIALYAVLFRRSNLTFMILLWQFKLAAPVYVGIWFAFNLAGWFAGQGGVAWSAHLGGFFLGLLVGGLCHRSLLRRRPLLRLLNEGARHPNAALS